MSAALLGVSFAVRDGCSSSCAIAAGGGLSGMCVLCSFSLFLAVSLRVGSCGGCVLVVFVIINVSRRLCYVFDGVVCYVCGV